MAIACRFSEIIAPFPPCRCLSAAVAVGAPGHQLRSVVAQPAPVIHLRVLCGAHGHGGGSGAPEAPPQGHRRVCGNVAALLAAVVTPVAATEPSAAVAAAEPSAAVAVAASAVAVAAAAVAGAAAAVATAAVAAAALATAAFGTALAALAAVAAVAAIRATHAARLP